MMLEGTLPIRDEDGTVIDRVRIKSVKLNPKKKDYILGHKVELVPLYSLYRYREYDFSDLREPDQLEEMKESLLKEGWKEPLMIVYYKKDKYLTLGEGNHRLHAAKDLGMTHVPVRVYLNSSRGKGKANSKWSRPYKQISNDLDTSGYVPADLYPSDIGMRNTIKFPK